MGKKVIVNEKVLRSLLMEMAKERISLNEIKVEDAYRRFYEGKIAPETYATIMSGTKNMTPFHKRVLDIICSYNGNMPPDLNSLPTLVKQAWNKSETAKQFLVNAVEMDAYSVKNGISLYYFLTRFINMERFTEAEYYKDGLVKLFENDRLLVTATLSYAASQKYYGDSHWCTASGIDGVFDGWKMYNDYTEDEAILLQFVDKSRREHSYQAQYIVDWRNSTNGNQVMRTSQICDFEDNGASQYELEEFLTNLGVDYNELIKTINFQELQEKADNLNKDESEYWNIRVPYYEKKMFDKVSVKFNDPSFEKLISEKLASELMGDSDHACPFYFEECMNRIYPDPDIKVYRVELELYHEKALKRLGIFDQNELNFFSRLANDDSDTQGQTYWTIVTRRNAKILYRFNGWAKSYVGNAVVVSFNENVTPYSVLDGKQLIKDPDATAYKIKDQKFLYFGQRSSNWTEIEALYCIDAETLEVKKTEPKPV